MLQNSIQNPPTGFNTELTETLKSKMARLTAEIRRDWLAGDETARTAWDETRWDEMPECDSGNVPAVLWLA